MKSKSTPALFAPSATSVAVQVLTLAAMTLLVSGCGGGGDSTSAASSDAAMAAATSATPAFTRLAEALPEPVADDGSSLPTDSTELAMALEPMTDIQLTAAASGTQTMVVGSDEASGPVMTQEEAESQGASAPTLTPSAAATTTTVTPAVFNPAQIRAAYGLAALPSSYSNLTAAQAAALGAGQTIYIVDAYHYSNVLTDLAAFSAKFGLPTCTTVTVNASTKLPLATPPTNACNVAVVYTDVAKTSPLTPKITTTVPAYNAGWASEIALDVQWAHALAPLARIVLIESQSASMNGMMAAVIQAKSIGSGIVSMSFAAVEGSWISTYSGLFANAGMSYMAATGDWATQSNFPAVNANVLAVGGTSLMFSGSARTELAWANTGGAISSLVAMPSYQTPFALTAQTVKGVKYRGTADVSFNANPTTGQYVAFTAPGKTSASWYSYGGTSISTPQWAGLVAVANAQRALAGKAVLGGNVQTALYSIAGNATKYAQAFLDVSSGSNGSCTACSAKTGYDIPTGLGSPNAAALLPMLVAY